MPTALTLAKIIIVVVVPSSLGVIAYILLLPLVTDEMILEARLVCIPCVWDNL